MLYSLENVLFTQYGKSRLQNVDGYKWNPNLGDFRYRYVNFDVHVSHSAYLMFQPQISNNISKVTNVSFVILVYENEAPSP